MMRKTSVCILFLSAVCLVGCGEAPEVRAYDSAKPELGFVELSGLMYRPPMQWKSMGRTQMLLAVYEIEGGAKMTISQARGTPTSNINRWRGQLGMEPLAEPVDLATLQSIQTDAGTVLVVDLVTEADNPEARRFKVAMLPVTRMGEQTGMTWFFKFDGSSELVERERETFETLLQELHPTKENRVSDGY